MPRSVAWRIRASVPHAPHAALHARHSFLSGGKPFLIAFYLQREIVPIDFVHLFSGGWILATL